MFSIILSYPQSIVFHLTRRDYVFFAESYEKHVETRRGREIGLNEVAEYVSKRFDN